jgi:hypothetical protein
MFTLVFNKSVISESNEPFITVKLTGCSLIVTVDFFCVEIQEALSIVYFYVDQKLFYTCITQYIYGTI